MSEARPGELVADPDVEIDDVEIDDVASTGTGSAGPDGETAYRPSRGAQVAAAHGRANVLFMVHLVALCLLALPSVIGLLLAWAAHRIAERDLTWADRLARWSRAFFVVDLLFYLGLIAVGLTLAVHGLRAL